MTDRSAEKRQSSCDGKVRFETYEIAAQVHGRKTRRHAGSFTPYRCSFCGGYHLGGTNGKPPAGKKA